MGSQPRSFAEALRASSDDDLAALVTARPDLLNPVPADLAQLAARASSGPSVARALDHLDRFHLQVLEALCLDAAPAGATRLAARLPGADAEQVDAALRTLARWGLVWADGTPDGAVHPLTAVRDALGASAGGLGPPLDVLLTAQPAARLQTLAEDLGLSAGTALAETLAALHAHLSDPAALDAVLADAPAAATEVLEHLLWGTAYGSVPNADRPVRVASAVSPVEWLLARGLLLPTDRGTVALPREVALHLRGGRAFDRAETAAPEPPTAAAHDPAQVDRTAGAQAFGFVRAVESLLDAWGVDPPPVLRAGGLGVRELRRAATVLDADEPLAALVVETAYATGLLGPTSDADPVWLPTPAYDLWRADETTGRWVALASAWRDTTRVPALVGSRDAKDKALAALGPDLDRALAPEVRRGLLDVLAAAAPGTPVGAADVDAVLAWRRPRRPARLRAELVAGFLREAEQLGATGRGALSGPGRALLADDPAAARAALEPLLPQPLDHVLLQADLTAVAPGPLVSDLAQALALMADVESTGGATVYRFSESSVRRALDAGRAAADLHAVLATHSRTPVPQPLAYLVDDVARRHGRIRVGVASAYVRCDDDAVLTELLAQRKAGELRLRRLAPTVLVAQAPVEAVLEVLRALGFAPAAESADGAVLTRRPDARRTATRPRPPRLAAEHPAPGERLVTAAVRALRAGERATSASRGPVVGGVAGGGSPPRSAAADTLALLRTALEEGRPVWIGYVDTHGGVTERVVDPVRLAGGYLTAYDHRSAEVHTFAVHRITGAAALEDEPA